MHVEIYIYIYIMIDYVNELIGLGAWVITALSHNVAGSGSCGIMAVCFHWPTLLPKQLELSLLMSAELLCL